VVDIRRVRSLQRYRFLRVADGNLLVKGKTDWVFVNAKTGLPMAVPEERSSKLFRFCLRTPPGGINSRVWLLLPYKPSQSVPQNQPGSFATLLGSTLPLPAPCPAGVCGQ
jgi:hypothetical protein